MNKLRNTAQVGAATSFEAIGRIFIRIRKHWPFSMIFYIVNAQVANWFTLTLPAIGRTPRPVVAEALEPLPLRCARRLLRNSQ